MVPFGVSLHYIFETTKKGKDEVARCSWQEIRGGIVQCETYIG